jgi:hypothetical protein
MGVALQRSSGSQVSSLQAIIIAYALSLRREAMFCQASFDPWPTTIMQHLPQLSKPQATVLVLWSFGNVGEEIRLFFVTEVQYVIGAMVTIVSRWRHREIEGKKKGHVMTESTGISREHFRVLVERAGLQLSDAELTALQPMFDFYAEQLPKLHEVELGAEELAVTFLPQWDAQI